MTTPLTMDDTLRATFAPRFELVRPLGRGGMASVYLARERALKRFVALKVLDVAFEGTPEADRFRRESRLLTTLQHPHILPALAVGREGPYDWYSMPFIEGESLRVRLDREGRLPVDDAVYIGAQLLDALAYTHRHNVIHRDVKPDNVMLGTAGALLGDFGIARRVAVDPDGPQTVATRTGVAIGTPAYMSPEQIAADRSLDGRSDQYSVAVVLYQCLAGRLPITGKSATEFMTRHMVETPAPLLSFAPCVPVAVAATIHRALAKVPAERFDSAGTFRDALLDAFADLPAPRPREAGVTPLRAAELQAPPT